MTTLLIDTSPRSTWITAPGRSKFHSHPQLLVGRFNEVRRRGQLDPFGIDVGIRVRAMDAAVFFRVRATRSAGTPTNTHSIATAPPAASGR